MERLEFHTIGWQITDGIGHLILDQPPSNKMSLEFFREMAKLKNHITRLAKLKALIIEGSGRHFSSGADLDELLPAIAKNSCAEDFLQTNYGALSFVETLTWPVISAIRGVCLGSALELALFCHFRFCSEEAVFGLPETNFNLIPGIGGIQRFASLSGNARALEYILTGRTFDAQTAFELGIVDAIFKKKELAERAVIFLRQLPGTYDARMRKVYLRRYVKRET